MLRISITPMPSQQLILSGKAKDLSRRVVHERRKHLL